MTLSQVLLVKVGGDWMLGKRSEVSVLGERDGRCREFTHADNHLLTRKTPARLLVQNQTKPLPLGMYRVQFYRKFWSSPCPHNSINSQPHHGLPQRIAQRHCLSLEAKVEEEDRVPSDFTFLISDTRIYRTTLETATAKFH